MTAFTLAQDVFLSAIRKENMQPLMQGGVLLALSGGADSVLLLHLLADYCHQNSIRLCALHVNHGIRGKQADEDAAFCQSLCQRYDIPFVLCHADVPTLARERKKGIEETARDVRYAFLRENLQQMGLAVIATAHNATDNAETVLLHLMRGTGGRGMCGILPTRDGVIRPLLALTKGQVMAAVQEVRLSHVIDVTNADTSYRRNYIRAEILPRLAAITEEPERPITRMTEALRSDMAYLDALADKAAQEALMPDGKMLSRKALQQMPDALLYRVLMAHHAKLFPQAERPERVHLTHLTGGICGEEAIFYSAFPSDITAVVCNQTVTFIMGQMPVFDFGHFSVNMGENKLPNGACLVLSDAPIQNHSTIVYKKLIQRNLSSATIGGELFVRSRLDGDAYRYGGMTHKLKKLFSDAKIPQSERDAWPVLCDEKGIVWVPGFGVRDDGNSNDASPLFACYFYEFDCATERVE